MMLASSTLYATTYTITFAYDAAGNRISRTSAVTVGKSSKMGDQAISFYENKDSAMVYRLYPNPTRGAFRFEVQPFDASTHKAKIILADGNGRRLEVADFTGEKSFNIEAQPQGLYLLTLQIDGKEMVWKILKQ